MHVGAHVHAHCNCPFPTFYSCFDHKEIFIQGHSSLLNYCGCFLASLPSSRPDPSILCKNKTHPWYISGCWLQTFLSSWVYTGVTAEQSLWSHVDLSLNQLHAPNLCDLHPTWVSASSSTERNNNIYLPESLWKWNNNTHEAVSVVSNTE